MKFRNREVNIFSMSALDLFASSMGAFMLLSVMALPFFPNTGDSPELVAEVKEQLEQAKEDLEQAKQDRDQAQRDAEAAEKKAAELEVPDLDLVICLDITGSMGGEIEGLKLQINELARILNALSPTGIGIVAFGDILWDRPIESLDISAAPSLVEKFVDNLRANKNLGGGENPSLPEAVHLALAEAVELNWRSESKSRHIVVITDAPGSDPNSALQRAATFAGANGRHVSAVMVGGNDAESFMKQLAVQGGGDFVDGNKRTMVGSILLAVLGT